MAGTSLHGLVTCEHPRCHARFFLVEGRDHARLCNDHADEVRRQLAWTPENSAD